MKKVAIVIGHTPKAPGAVFGEWNEFEFNRHVGEATASCVRALKGPEPVVVYRDLPDQYAGLPAKVNATGADLAVELHLNAAGTPQANGLEVLYFTHSKPGLQAAAVFVAAISAQFEQLVVRHRSGVLPLSGDERGGWFLRKTRMPALILEPGFISSPLDRPLLLANPGRLAQAYADAILELHRRD